MDDKKKKQAFLKRLLETFVEEADEHIKAISAGLVQLENSTGPHERERHGEYKFINLTFIKKYTFCQ